jgi:hypothetical protein
MRRVFRPPRTSDLCNRSGLARVLPDIGIKGNTHMLMQDDNNLDIADILLDWIGKHAAAGQ